MASAETFEQSPATLFAALGDPTRLSIVHRLSDGASEPIARLAAEGRLTRQAVTKHLKVLESAGLVRSVRVGRESRYALRPEQVALARDYLDEVSRQWDEALARLKLYVEG